MTTSDGPTEKADLLDQLVKKYRQRHSGISNVLASYATVDEAAETLPPERLKSFCERVGLDHGSEKFEYELRLGSRYRRWLGTFGKDWVGVAFLYLAATSDPQFDTMIKDGTEFMKLIEQSDESRGVN